MIITPTRSYNLKSQLFLSVFLVLIVSCICFFSNKVLAYNTVALILLMTLSLLGMLFDILPILIASCISAAIWNYFFIPPIFTFHIKNTQDVLMFFLYFFIAMLHAVLSFQIRKAEKRARDKEEKEKTILLYDTLLNSLSHELRTPIATIISSVDTLKENKTSLSFEYKNEILNQIDIASVRLNRQVENLLHMSRLESGTLKLNIEWTDLNDLIFSSIQKLKPYAQNHSIDFEFQPHFPLCKIDANIIEQVLYNLLFNALQYTPSQSKIKINTSIKDQILWIMIADNGPGIPPQYLSKIFEKFYRLPYSRAGGTGLGLSIAKGFIDAHQGSIFAENCSPTGLKFVIKLPTSVSYINNLKHE